MSNNLLNVYGKFMRLKIYVTDEHVELKQKYRDAASNHNNKVLNPDNKYLDAGFDLFVPCNYDSQPFELDSQVKIDFKIVCAASMVTDNGKTYNTGYYMDPRSSISKTSLRLANSRGIIDSGYRGPLIGMFDVVKQNVAFHRFDNPVFPLLASRYERVTQICAPSLEPILVEIVDCLEELGERTERGTGGFGSTGI